MEDKNWIKFAAGVAKTLGKIERDQVTFAAVSLITAMEELVHSENNCPPGMISCWATYDGESKEVEHIKFHIDPAGGLMGCPEEIQNRTLQTIVDGWEYFERSLVLWHKGLSEIEDDREKDLRIAQFKISFVACCYSRNHGLWFSPNANAPRQSGQLQVWETFTNTPSLGEVLEDDPVLDGFHYFNMNGAWPDE